MSTDQSLVFYLPVVQKETQHELSVRVGTNICTYDVVYSCFQPRHALNERKLITTPQFSLSDSGSNSIPGGTQKRRNIPRLEQAFQCATGL